MDAQLRDRITQIIKSQPTVLFMKGVRTAPQCGFSASVIGILDKYLDSYHTVDVLRDPAIREAIKEFSNWPTIPQLYVKGEFLGGCDILREMDASGELAKELGAEAKGAPTVQLTPAAIEAVKSAMSGAEPGDGLRLEVNSQFANEMSLGPVSPGDYVIELEGLRLLIDPSSARRADGVIIDFVNQGGEQGFRVDNPNAPRELNESGSGSGSGSPVPAGDGVSEETAQQVKALSVQELKAMMDRNDEFELYDVRSEGERGTASVENSEPFTIEAFERLQDIDRKTTLVFMCHHGHRSRAAAEQVVQLGFATVYNVIGGIDAWAQDVDRTMTRY